MQQPTGGSFLDRIRGFDRTNLQHTETVVSHIPLVDADFKSLVGAPTEEEVKEYYDEPDVFKAKAQQIARLILQSNHLVVYTGAGISTSARIPDYRGPQGVWTLQAKGLTPFNPCPLTEAKPTYTHRALTHLVSIGKLKCIVSTNVDGLHRRSGTPPDLLSELHGNMYVERCTNKECLQEYFRDYDTTLARQMADMLIESGMVVKSNNTEDDVDPKVAMEKRRHTGRQCDACGAPLRDTIVNFTETLPQNHYRKAYEHSKQADLTLVLGSSMRVSPANALPSYSYKQGHPFCLVNLQKTDYDSICDKSNGARVYGKIDEFMKLVMDELGIVVPDN